MQRVVKFFFFTAVVSLTSSLFDYHYKREENASNVVDVQTLVPNVDISPVSQKDNKKNNDKNTEFKEENPEVTSGDEETLIEDE